MLPIASRIAALAAVQPTPLAPEAVLGSSPPLAEALDRLQRFARIDQPLLITGASGTGKELFARAAHLLSPQIGGPFLALNCAQFTDESCLLAALVGSREPRGERRKGLFESADGGVLLLDEIADLPARVQAVLLRVISNGEVLPHGALEPVRVAVRVIATTARDPRALVERGELREELYYRLRRLHLHLPPLHERGDDWRWIARSHLGALAARHGSTKRFARGALDALRGHTWPGNVREVHGVVETAYCLSDGEEIEASTLRAGLDPGLWRREPCRASRTTDAFERMKSGGASFWSAVRDPYLDRELNRAEVRDIVRLGLAEHGGSYKRALPSFGLAEGEYLRFMDFLRHHRLKPHRAAARAA